MNSLPTFNPHVVTFTAPCPHCGALAEWTQRGFRYEIKKCAC